jgi:hypothetical protein
VAEATGERGLGGLALGGIHDRRSFVWVEVPG